ncbi:UBX domain-containing protein [Parasponia andersonii]|uniref:UBX domain-containing protein n=1 Tax=Parasponia andersonii TaxID=3476 RepID=A0A2P5AYM4_PARAD|nr:UBX domain-containing protein [Parasponia andersonii]
MEAEAHESQPLRDDLITSFCEIASSSKEEALFFLESHNWDLDAAVSTFLDDNPPPTAAADHPVPENRSPSPSQSPEYSPTHSRSRSPSPTLSRPPYELRSRRASDKKADKKPSGSRTRGGIRTLADLNRPAHDGSGSDSDEHQEYYTGGEKRWNSNLGPPLRSGMLVQDPTKGNDVDAIFDQAKKSGAMLGSHEHARPSSSSKCFTGTARLLTGETVSSDPQPPEVVTHTITFWRNGFSVDDGPLRRLDDPENAPFLESIRQSKCPQELEPADRRTSVHVDMIRREEDYPEPVKLRNAFQGVGRTLGSGSSTASEPATAATSLNTSPLSSMRLVVDDSLPSTSLQLRLADGTRMVSRFNHHHTIRDIRSFIDASRPGGPISYQLQTMGFPPKQLTDLDLTIEQAGIANSVVIQKL